MPQQGYLLIGEKYEDFLWGCQENKRKDHIISWQQVCLPLDAGGLDVRPIKDVNVALLSKCLWRFASEKEAPWKSLLISNHSLGNFGPSILLPAELLVCGELSLLVLTCLSREFSLK